LGVYPVEGFFGATRGRFFRDRNEPIAHDLTVDFVAILLADLPMTNVEGQKLAE
jgi:hypothetical protein